MGREAEAVIAALGASRFGVITTALARDAGVRPAHLEALRRRGTLVGLGRGVMRLRDHPFDFTSRCRAALDLAGPSAVLGLRAAARLHEFHAYSRSEEVEVLVARGRDQRCAVGRIRQTRHLPPEHCTEVLGLAVTTPARTFFDLCGDPDRPLRHRGVRRNPPHEAAMARVYNDAVARRGVTFQREAEVLSALARRGRAGTDLVRRILRAHPPDEQPVWSDLEWLFLELVRSHGLPEPRKQVKLSGAEGFIGTVDFLWERARHVVEVDSRWHDGPLDKQRDAERDALLRAAGFSVSRYRYSDIVLEPSRVALELGVAIRP